jgi:hypothetical protein
MRHKSLNQLLCAATVNSTFCEMLLRDPDQAIRAGYLDHTFSLTPEERELVVGIRAQRLEDFAAEVYTWITGEGNRNGHAKANGHAGRRNGVGVRLGETPPAFTDYYHVPVPVHA